MRCKNVSKSLISLITLFAFLNLQGLALSQPNYQEKETGTLIIESEPPQAKIYIEGKFVGETPKTIKNILPGTYKVRIEKENHTDYIEEINIVAMQTVKIVARLEFTQDYKKYLEQKRLEQERQERLRKEAEEMERKRQEEQFKKMHRKSRAGGVALLISGIAVLALGAHMQNKYNKLMGEYKDSWSYYYEITYYGESNTYKGYRDKKNIGICLTIGGAVLTALGIWKTASPGYAPLISIENAPVDPRITVGYRINF